MKLTYMLRDNGGCGYYRLKLPLETLSLNTGEKLGRIEKGDKADVILTAIDHADVIVIPRMGEEMFVEQIPQFKDCGKKVVIDHDDNMFEISPLSPHYEDCGIENVKYRMPNGELIDVWQDGKNIDLARNANRRVMFKKAMELADMVTVTTDILKGTYSECNKNIKVLPNCVDMKLWQKLPLKEHKGVRICWFGGSSHYEDWLILAPVLEKVIKKYKEVTLVIMGMKFDGTLKGIPSDRIEFHEWVHTEAYPYKAAILDCDISVIPLVDNQFNRCKSPIKWIEQASLGIPSVTSYVSPYREIMEEGNGVYITDNDPGLWLDGISMLIEDKGIRVEMGEKAKDTVKRRFDINTQWVQWHNAYKELLA